MYILCVWRIYALIRALPAKGNGCAGPATGGFLSLGGPAQRNSWGNRQAQGALQEKQ